ncbi:endolytic transglycosylase MltG [Brachyspira innocens]|uniref:Endolytic murein transglycosylase n=1 Tax=Brachyspira innocens TaxID=13264 RepID=A0ABT8YZ66_9SPIR|nr:endolytic transglycosylase MltG [Brachyspira innocens]MDO6992653.1 endolytic transglycosylase MltG [Brachyspira innocens]MDO7020434.1 endolytic transglycosylase MltG [Brachyspira innocens]
MKKLLIILIILAAIVSASSVAFIQYMISPVGGDSDKVYFEIKQGEGASTIAKKLELQGLIRNSKIFVVFAKYLKYDRKLLSGYYQVDRSMSMIDIMKHLNSGKQAMVRLTIAEGKNIYEIGAYLEAQGFTTKKEFLEVCHDKEILQKYNIPSDSVEGYIFPSTYYIVKGNPTKVLVTYMIDSLFKQFPDLEDRAKKIGRSVHEVLTMASIVEKEMGPLDDPKLISSVYYNRLNIDKRLEADPTTIYAMTLVKGDYIEKPNLKYADLRMEHLYNTYKNTGLPPGPICSAGAKAIEAALNPADTDYIFFVADGTGKHAFSVTYEEHVENINRYIFKR